MPQWVLSGSLSTTEEALAISEDLVSWTSANLTDEGSARESLFGIDSRGGLAALLGEVAGGIEVLEDVSVCARIAFLAVKGVWERYSAVNCGIPTICSGLCRTLLDAASQLKR